MAAIKPKPIPALRTVRRLSLVHCFRELYESWTFFKPQRLRTLEEIKADIHALQAETEGLLEKILVETEVTP